MIKPDTWFDGINTCEGSARPYVLVTVLSAAGSTPRNAGTKMVIVDDGIYDTIGGGHLEHQAIRLARELLASGKHTQHIEHYPLSSKLGQCCGGATNLLFEVMTSHQKHLAVFGAGHVSKALIPILAQLPLQISWIDPREAMFSTQLVPNNVTIHLEEDPVDHMKGLTPGSLVLILTHNHQLDFDLVETALGLDRFPYIGMIGSDTKSRRFRTRLANKGVPENLVEKLVCPVGVSNVSGKRPIEVAVSIAGQIIQQINNEGHQDKESLKQAWIKTQSLSKLI